MAVTPPSSNTTIANAGIVAMHDSVRTVVNAQDRDTIERSAFGNQHIQEGVVVTCDLNESSTMETISFTADAIGAETTADIPANWKHLTSYDLDNGGAGYSLPACKVLIWFDCRIRDLDFSGGGDQNAQAWLALYYSINGTPIYKLVNMGMVQGHVNYDLLEEPICITDVIDQTAAGGTWTLNWIRVSAAMGRGSGGAPVPGLVEFLQGNTGMIAFYKDE